mmetsp:Transcript_47193/g.112430  ORF Transcript_47193/g.112430 Transcript_47193/m.112430 type:complete len:208 (+) Transcript_47193:68-691(+)
MAGGCTKLVSRACGATGAPTKIDGGKRASSRASSQDRRGASLLSISRVSVSVRRSYCSARRGLVYKHGETRDERWREEDQQTAAERCVARRSVARETFSRCPRLFFSAPMWRPHHLGSPVYGASSTTPRARAGVSSATFSTTAFSTDSASSVAGSEDSSSARAGHCSTVPSKAATMVGAEPLRESTSWKEGRSGAAGGGESGPTRHH